VNSRLVKPRVLCLTGAYFPEFSAGGLQCQGVARTLAQHAGFVVLTTATDQCLPTHDLVDGVPVSRIGINVHSRWRQGLAAIRLICELIRLLPRVDVVHIQGFSRKNLVATALSKLFGRAVVIHLQTSKHDEPVAVRARGLLSWWAFRSADTYLSVSPGLTASYLKAGLPAARVREIPNGVDAARFSPASDAERQALRQQLYLPADRPIILFVGVMMPDKQPHVLLDAWLQMRRATGIASTLIFVGATDPRLFELADRLAERLRVEADASGFGSDVRFVPPTAAIENYFRVATVFVMPSVREGLPIVLLEAMACGLPVVASLLHGATDSMIEPGVNGLLVSAGDVAGFAAALGTLLSTPDEAARLGAAARRTVQNRYTLQLVAAKWLDAYRAVIANR